MNEKKRNERKIDLELPDITFRAKKNERKFIMKLKVVIALEASQTHYRFQALQYRFNVVKTQLQLKYLNTYSQSANA